MSSLIAYARIVAAAALVSVAQAQTASQPAASVDFFETKIRPVLAANCFSCHTSNKMGGLRLDSAEAMLQGGKSGPAVVPGDVDKSLLMQLVKHADAKKRMPMGAKLKDAEISALGDWIKAGAVWPKSELSTSKKAADGEYVIHPEQRKFWSFQPLKSPEPPAVKNVKWTNTAIDKFILARLEKDGIAPVKTASRRDLIRRATLGLTGLPPTAEEIEAFEKDSSKDAWAKVVDRLLASPQYGERWGRFWLDVARYGEDDYRSLDPMRRGYNPYPNAYLFRDWVVKAFNDDMPFDMFVKAQIAGDLLDEKVRYQTVAGTGFLGLGPWYYDNGAVEVTRADERHDRVDAITRGFLGLTVACARCHDHKYDPIPQKDYYSLAGVFYNTQYEEYPLAPKSVVSKFTKIEEAVDTKNKLLGETQQNLSAQLARTLAFETANYLEGVYDVTGKSKKEIAQVVEDRKLDYELLARWIRYMGRTTDKYKNKDAWQAMIKKDGGTPEEAKKLAEKLQSDVVAVMLARAEIDEENKVISDKAIEGTKKKKRTNKPSNFVTNDDFCPGCGLQLKTMPEDVNFFYTEVFQRELNDSDDPNAMMAAGNRFGKPGVLAFRGWGLERRLGSEALAQINSLKNDVEAERKKLDPYFPFAHGVKDLPAIKELPLSIRGNPENLGPEVPRHFLSVLSEDKPALFTKGSGRVELAEALSKQPLAMRVFVNRVWRGHFGTGLVDTPSNFGTTGERPTNPELLEYLANSFVKNGMSVKKLQREILLSSVYQLSSEDNPAASAKDQSNRLYWRFNKQRMDAEQLRDSVLLVSGNLDDAVGGPSTDLTPANKRRTLYGKVSRYKLDEYLQLFDFPNPSISAERRFTTTVPLQRLFLMNSDFMQVQAEELAKRIAPEPDNRARVKKLYQLVYGRVPTEQEIQIGVAYVKSEPLLEYEEGKKKAAEQTKGAGAGPRKRGGGEEGKSPETPPSADGGAATGMAMKPEKKAEEASAAASTTEKGAEKAEKKEEGKKEAKTISAEAKPAADAKDMDDMDPEEKAKALMGKGMMGGMMGMGGRRGGGPGGPPPVKYEPTAWGRYAKVLLSSSEFLFIN